MSGSYQCKCPGCGYRYRVLAISEQDWEICPICGCSQKFSEFVERKLILSQSRTADQNIGGNNG